jgi:hypothetical protein
MLRSVYVEARELESFVKLNRGYKVQRKGPGSRTVGMGSTGLEPNRRRS